MIAAIKMTCSLLKLRIGIAIAATALAGMAAASGPKLSCLQIVGFAIAVLGASGAAGAFNHYHERNLDRLMQRTNSRPFASGALQSGLGWPVAFLILLAVSLLLAEITGGALSAFFVFLGAFTYGFVYTVWLKRRTAWNIVVGGLAGSFAVLAGAAAVDSSLQPEPLALAVVLFLWTPPHFWSLAAVRREDYAMAGVPMLPIMVPTSAWTVAVLTHTSALVLVSLVPLWFGAGPLYGLGAGIGGLFFLWKSIALYRSPTRQAALANFLASLLQLTLLITGVLLEATFGSWS